MRKKLLFLTAATLMSLCACSRSGEKRESDSASVQTSETVKDPIEWEHDYFIDDFGKKSQKAYERTHISGVFSNSATTRSELTVIMYVEKDSTLYFKLAEYNMSLAKDFWAKAKVRNATGDVKDFTLYFDKEGGAVVLPYYNRDLISFIISEGEKDVLITEEQKYGGIPSTYIFSIKDGASIARAIERLK